MNEQTETESRAQARRAMLKALGSHVRRLRSDQGMSRHMLAERSGVSSRYLAQLELGDGNISVARLADIAQALCSTPARMLHQAEPPASGATTDERTRVEALLERRSAAELQEIGRWLTARFHPGADAGTSNRMIALLGMRGAGKSTIGRHLAQRLGLPFHELDQLLEETAGLTLREIFELHGEAYYRRLERETLIHYLASHEAGVLATGGSLVTDRESYRLLKRRALTVWLKARPEDHWNRVIQQGDQRPMAQHPHAMQELRALLAARDKLYAEAACVVDTSAQGIEDVVETLIQRIGHGAVGS